MIEGLFGRREVEFKALYRKKERNSLRSPISKTYAPLAKFTLVENYAKNRNWGFRFGGLIIGSSSAETLRAEEQDVWNPC